MTAPPDEASAPEVATEAAGSAFRGVWLLAGASGFLGTALTNDLRRRGRSVRRLVRGDPSGPDEVRWDPASGRLDPTALDEVGVVVNLAGVSIQKRWTAANRKAILDSRVQTTGTLARAIASRSADLPVFLAQSATGYYAKHQPQIAGVGYRVTTEANGERNPGFLGDVCAEWEAAADPAREAGARVVHLRTGVVLDSSGGALPLMSIPFKLGLGVPLGHGMQEMAIIGLIDWLAAVHHLAGSGEVEGPANLVIPTSVTNRAFTDTLARVLHRPRLPKSVVVPDPIVRIALDGFATDLLDGTQLYPEVVERSGFVFAHPSVGETVEAAVHR